MKKIKRLLCLVMAVVTAMSMSISASSDSSVDIQNSSIVTEPIDDNFVLVSEEQFVDEQYLIVDRTYVLSDLSTRDEGYKKDTFKKSRSI